MVVFTLVTYSGPTPTPKRRQQHIRDLIMLKSGEFYEYFAQNNKIKSVISIFWKNALKKLCALAKRKNAKRNALSRNRTRVESNQLLMATTQYTTNPTVLIIEKSYMDIII